jgi:acetoin utilization deacetylase AcuC-like enzyme
VPLSVPVVWSDEHRLHDPESVYWIGVREENDETPARAAAIREALEEAGAEVVPAIAHADDTLLGVHDAGLVEFLRNAWSDWSESGYPKDAGQSSVVGYLFPTPGFLAGVSPRVPASLAARTGAWCYDTMTVVGQGTWEAARAAVDVALTATDLVADGAPVAYGCCRPPGHHVTRSAFGGSCFLNNAAVAAQRLRERGFGRVAVLDMDAHHGNGAQAIFAERADVLTASVHVDPAHGWFPHFVGFADESGPANLSVPLPPGSGDEAWLEGLGRLALAAREHRSDALVVALGVDAADSDPNAPLAVTEAGFRDGGRLLGSLALPTVLVQEGGYVLGTIGALVRSVLEGFEEGAGR